MRALAALALAGHGHFSGHARARVSRGCRVVERGTIGAEGARTVPEPEENRVRDVMLENLDREDVRVAIAMLLADPPSPTVRALLERAPLERAIRRAVIGAPRALFAMGRIEA